MNFYSSLNMGTCIRLSGLSSVLHHSQIDSSLCIRYLTKPSFRFNKLARVNGRFTHNTVNTRGTCSVNLYYRPQHMSRHWTQKGCLHNTPRTNQLTEITARKSKILLAETRVLNSLNAIINQRNGLYENPCCQARSYSSQSGSGGGGDNAASGAAASSGGGDEEDDGNSSDGDAKAGTYTQPEQTFPPTTALTAMTVPEIFPNVPIIALHKYPLFPKFIKFIEVRIDYGIAVNNELARQSWQLKNYIHHHELWWGSRMPYIRFVRQLYNNGFN